MHHKLDIHPIPEEMLYVNDPSLAVKVPYETEDEMEKAVTGKKKSEELMKAIADSTRNYEDIFRYIKVETSEDEG